MNIGNKLKQLRKEHHLSQEQFAELFHISRQTVSRWEANISSPDIKTFQKICDYYQMNIDEFLEQSHKTKYPNSIYFIFILCSFLCIILSFFLPSTAESASSIVLYTPSMIAFIIGILSLPISLFLFIRNHKEK